MTGRGLDSEDALALLVAAPGTKEEKQRFFQERFEIKAPRTNYDLMWDRLVDELGEDQAAEAVCSLVLSCTDSRAIQLLRRAAMGRPVGLRLNEPSLVDLLFDRDEELTTMGEALADRTRRVQEPAPVTPAAPNAPNRAPPPATSKPTP